MKIYGVIGIMGNSGGLVMNKNLCGPCVIDLNKHRHKCELVTVANTKQDSPFLS